MEQDESNMINSQWVRVQRIVEARYQEVKRIIGLPYLQSNTYHWGDCVRKRVFLEFSQNQCGPFMVYKFFNDFLYLEKLRHLVKNFEILYDDQENASLIKTEKELEEWYNNIKGDPKGAVIIYLFTNDSWEQTSVEARKYEKVNI